MAAGSFGMLVGMLLVFLVFTQRESQIEKSLVDDYGNALATMAANGAIDAMFNHDLVSLQVILQDVVRNPRVEIAAIHDVENNLLVQAGESLPRNQQNGFSTFTSPIPLHDSVAGYVAITVDARFEAGGLVYGVLCVCAILLLIAILSLQEVRDEVFVRVERSREASIPETPEIDPDDLDADPYLEEVSPIATGRLFITIANWDVLAKQISGDLLEQTLQQLTHRIHRVVSLYSGGSVHEPGAEKGDTQQAHFVIQIPSYDSCSDASIKAMCAAHLLTDCMQSQSFHLALRAYVEVAGDKDLAEVDLSYLKADGLENGIYFGQGLVDKRWTEGVTFKQVETVSETEHEGLCRVTQFLSPYLEWLEDQKRVLNG